MRIAALVVWMSLAASAFAGELEDRFRTPPEATKPRCYWYWMDGYVTREGITRDLEAMKRVGIGEGYIGLIDGQSGATPNSELKALSEPWWRLIEHAVREGTRLGVDIGVFNSPGWSQSGGPWVKPQESMRYMVFSQTRLTGPQRFVGRLPKPADAFQDVAVLAFPAPEGDADTAAARGATVTRTPASVTFTLREPFTARSLSIRPAKAMQTAAQLRVSDDGREFRTVRKFTIDRHNVMVGVGPVGLTPVVIAFPAVTARHFQVTLAAPSELADVDLSAAARVDTLAEKSLLKSFQDPLPPYDFYLWPRQPEPESPALAIRPDAVHRLDKSLAADGTLTWDVPAGEWIVLRAGMTPTGTKNGPAPLEATGPEVDKMSRPALAAHFNAFVGKLLASMPAADRASWKHVVADSYEQGPENWTDGLDQEFKARYGYDPAPLVPVLTGRLVGGAEQSNRFLWDLRRLVADRIARDYVGGLRDLCRRHGLKVWLENYGHWGFPSEFLRYGGASDEIGGEFWESGTLGSIELRCASSAAHIYGKRQVFAEAFTGGPMFASTPWTLKKRGDWALCQGINQFVLHVDIHQPREDRRPGMNAGFGTEFNRHNTWFEQSRSWIDYHRRCSVLLQEGVGAADVAYFIGEDTPKMTGIRQPELPPGYDYDYINAETLWTRARVAGGRLTLPDGTSYRLLVLPPLETMRPGLLEKLAALVRDGLTVVGPRPNRSPSLQDYPACDERVRALAEELWGTGKVIEAKDLAPVLAKLDAPPDVGGIDPARILFTHRRSGDTDVYFLSNQTDQPADIVPSFRVTGRAPSFWHPDSGRIDAAGVYDVAGPVTRVPLRLPPRGSVFVVFRGNAAADRIVEARHNGKPILTTMPTEAAVQATDRTPAVPGTFTIAVWVQPTDDTPLFDQSNRGAIDVNAGRNDVIVPAHGDTIVPGGGHAGSGLSVGRNGVCVIEHGANYFAPVLVHRAALSGWTHVAVVYDRGTPSLYLGGRLVHTGLKGPLVAHPGSPDGPFRGQVGPFAQYSRPLTAAEIAQLAKTPPASGEAPLEIVRNAAGRIEARAFLPGSFELKSADGRKHSFTHRALPKPLELAGPWDVRFPAESGVASPLRFDRLVSWTERPEPRVKYFSGEAAYTTQFTVPPGLLDGSTVVQLDLGRVESLAEVRLNGEQFDTLWKLPYRLEVTERLKPGVNQLEVRVVNVWHNRLVGNQRAPQLLGDFKPWASTMPAYGPGEPLFASGLIGPVTLRCGLKTTLR